MRDETCDSWHRLSCSGPFASPSPSQLFTQSASGPVGGSQATRKRASEMPKPCARLRRSADQKAGSGSWREELLACGRRIPVRNAAPLATDGLTLFPFGRPRPLCFFASALVSSGCPGLVPLQSECTRWRGGRDSDRRIQDAGENR